jgi:hypothetical protein
MRILLASLIATAALAQQVVAPTPEPVGSTRGENLDGYNVVNSFENGWRFRRVDGNLGKYRSDVNYGNGVRLLGSNLSINSREGQGRYFDEILLNTLGLGNDPYQAATFRLQKNGLYRYDLLWRLNEYYNPGLPIAGGQHLMDTRRRLQDHDFVLFPQSRLKFRFGYSRENQTGPALSTVQLFDALGDEFPIFMDVQRNRNEFRLGADLELSGWKLSLLRAWDNFREDSPYFQDPSVPLPGNNPGDQTVLERFHRVEPYHGNTPLWRVNLQRESDRWAANGRFTYAGGRRNFVLDETALGQDRFGAARNRQIVVRGSAQRPLTTGDLLLTFFPTTRLTLTNNTSLYNTRIDGDSTYLEFDNVAAAGSFFSFRFLGMRAIANSSELHFQASDWLGLRGGYQFSARRVRSIENTGIPGFPADGIAFEQDNHLHSGIVGLRLRPVKSLTINLDAEIGRADQPFFPIAERNYHLLNARLDYRTRSARFSAGYRQRYNTNSVSLSAHSARGRDYYASAWWTPKAWLTLDASYSKLHLDTVSGIAFFARASLVEGQRSVYISNIHAANLGAHFTLGRVGLFTGYSLTEDTGGKGGLTVFDPTQVLFGTAQVFPLRFHTPLARVSVRLTSKLRWNAGWQFYRYREDFPIAGVPQNYRAHTGYSSVLWSF